MTIMCLRRFVVSIFMAWARYSQYGPQNARFEHFRGLGPDMAKMGLRTLVLSIFMAWAQI